MHGLAGSIFTTRFINFKSNHPLFYNGVNFCGDKVAESSKNGNSKRQLPASQEDENLNECRVQPIPDGMQCASKCNDHTSIRTEFKKFIIVNGVQVISGLYDIRAESQVVFAVRAITGEVKIISWLSQVPRRFSLSKWEQLGWSFWLSQSPVSCAVHRRQMAAWRLKSLNVSRLGY